MIIYSSLPPGADDEAILMQLLDLPERIQNQWQFAPRPPPSGLNAGRCNLNNLYKHLGKWTTFQVAVVLDVFHDGAAYEFQIHGDATLQKNI